MTHGIAMLLTTDDIQEIVARFSLEMLLRKAGGEQNPNIKEVVEEILNNIREHATQA